MAEKQQFRKKTDYMKLVPLTALAYAGYVPSLYLQQTFTTAADYAGQFALISGVFLALRTPILREVPLALATVFNRLVLARGITAPDQQTLDDFEELKRKAGIRAGVRLHVYEKGITNNAFTDSKNVYVGRALVDKLNRAELKSVLAHELAHIKTGDVSERYLTWPPYVDSLLLAIGGFMTLVNAVGTGNGAAISAAAMTAAIGYGYFKLQSAISSSFSRIGEYRADRNGISLTGDFKSAATAMVKLDKGYIKQVSGDEQMFSSHPRGLDRLRAMEKSASADGTTPVFDLITAIDKDEDEHFKLRAQVLEPVETIERTHDYVRQTGAPAAYDGSYKQAVDPLAIQMRKYGYRPSDLFFY